MWGQIPNLKSKIRNLSPFFIFGPAEDALFVLFTPLLILLTFSASRSGGWIGGLLAFGLALAMAHYLPGILRAYGDRSLFHRFRLRLIVAPIFLGGVTLGFAYLNIHIVVLLALMWGAWHWAMQVYGFARIYDAKAAAAGRTPAWLDQTICLLWFGMAVFVLNNDLPSYLTRFYESGGPVLALGGFVWFVRMWVGLTIAATAIYVFWTARTIRGGGGPNLLKILFLLVTFAYLTYTVSVLERPLMGLVMFESWHDIQYLAIVWFFNLQRAQKSSDAGPFIRFLFRPRAILAAAYIVLCLAFGSLTHASHLFENPTAVRLAVALVTTTALLHYYLDGFIWKIRERDTRHAFGLRSSSEGGVVSLNHGWVRHAALWLLFAVPAGLFFVMESRGKAGSPLQVYELVAQTFPDSPSALFQFGKELQDHGRLREASEQLERALKFAPDLLAAHISLGVIRGDQGDYRAAQAQLEEALKIDPRNAEVHNNLGIVLDEQGDVRNARSHLERAVQIAPDYALAQNNLGTVLAKLGDLKGAREHHQAAIQADPDFADAHYQLGMILSQQNERAAAEEQFQAVLRLDPTHYLAHNSLGMLLVGQGKLSEARTHFEQALEVNPGYIDAKQNLAAATQNPAAEQPGVKVPQNP